MAARYVRMMLAGGTAAVGVVGITIAGYAAATADTSVVLGDAQGPCVVTTKANIDNGRKDQFVIWTIDNKCRNKDEMVTLGNFRAAEPSTAKDCLAPTIGTVAWPFQESPTDVSKRQHKNKISLKIKKDADLPGARLTYFFDICTGARAERKSDPRLVIEP